MGSLRHGELYMDIIVNRLRRLFKVRTPRKGAKLQHVRVIESMINVQMAIGLGRPMESVAVVSL